MFSRRAKAAEGVSDFYDYDVAPIQLVREVQTSPLAWWEIHSNTSVRVQVYAFSDKTLIKMPVKKKIHISYSKIIVLLLSITGLKCHLIGFTNCTFSLVMSFVFF